MKPQIVVYCCANSTWLSDQHVENLIPESEAMLKMVYLPCSGRSDVLYILKAFEKGADMAMVVGCPEGLCRFVEGNLRARKRVRYANRLLAEAGLGDERVRMLNLSPDDRTGFADALRDLADRAKKLGPWIE